MSILIVFGLIEVQVRDMEVFWPGFCIEFRSESNGTTPDLKIKKKQKILFFICRGSGSGSIGFGPKF